MPSIDDGIGRQQRISDRARHSQGQFKYPCPLERLRGEDHEPRDAENGNLQDYEGDHDLDQRESTQSGVSGSPHWRRTLPNPDTTSCTLVPPLENVTVCPTERPIPRGSKRNCAVVTVPPSAKTTPSSAPISTLRRSEPPLVTRTVWEPTSTSRRAPSPSRAISLAARCVATMRSRAACTAHRSARDPIWVAGIDSPTPMRKRATMSSRRV